MKKNPLKYIESYDINDEYGIITHIVRKNNKYVIEYCSDRRIISREYILVKWRITIILQSF